MKKYLLIIPVIILLFACKKDTSNSPSSSSGNDPFKYEVFCSSGHWSGKYISEDGAWTQVVQAGSNWTYSGTIRNSVFIPWIEAQPDPLAEGITFTLNLYYKGEKVKTLTFTTTNQTMTGQVSYVIR